MSMRNWASWPVTRTCRASSSSLTMSQTAAPSPKPRAIRLRKQSRVLELVYRQRRGEAEGECGDGGGDKRYRLPWEYLRVYSPSAEVRGHHPSQAVLQTGKQQVGIRALKPVGHYALQIVFDDGHDSGLYTWDYLYHLCAQREALWQAYLDALAGAGESRDPATQVLRFQPR